MFHRTPIRPRRLIRRAALPGLAMAVLALLSACAQGPDYQRPEVAVPAAWRAPQVDAADVVNTAWWETFGDPDLNRLIQDVLDANQDLQIATLRIEEFDALLQISRAALTPQLGVSGEVKRVRFSEQRAVPLPLGTDVISNSFEGSFNLSWELDLWGRVLRSNEAARAELLGREEARRGVMLTVATAAASSYMQLLGLDDQLAIMRMNLKNRHEALALIDAKFQGGSASKLDVARARVAAEEIETLIPELERQVAVLEGGVSVLMARPPGPVPRGKWQALKLPAVPQGVPSDLLARRPDVLAAEQDLVAANARIGVAKAQYFPRLSLTAVLGLSSKEASQWAQRPSMFGDIGPSMLATIFDGGRIAGDVRQTEALQKQAVLRYRQTVTVAMKEVEEALVSRSKAIEQTKLVGRQLESRREVSTLTRLRYEGGRSDLKDVLDAELQQLTTEQQQSTSRRDQVVALIAVYKAMGGGWMADYDQRRAVASAMAASAPKQETPE